MSTFEPYYSNDSWHLIHCKARKELYAANMLRSLLDLSIYLPEWKVYSRKKVQNVPFFPGYIFAQANLRKVALSQINATPGVLRLVEFGGTPQVVPAYVIEGIAERLKQMNGSQPQQFRQGDIVRLKHSGPLQDLEMIFVGPVGSSQRVNVLLNFLGRLKEAQVNIEALEKVRAS